MSLKDAYPRFNGKPVHRLVMEKHLGRKLRRDEHVHHIDNHIDNLEVLSAAEHSEKHSLTRVESVAKTSDNPIAKYLAESGINQLQLAKMSGFPGAMISEWSRDIGCPSLDSAFALEDKTDGKIPARSWVGRQRTSRASRNVSRGIRTRRIDVNGSNHDTNRSAGTSP